MKNIKTFEGFFDFLKNKKEPILPKSTYYWTHEEKEYLINIGFEFDNSNSLGYFKFEEMSLDKIAIAKNYTEDWFYRLIKDGKVIKEFSNLNEVEKFIKK